MTLSDDLATDLSRVFFNSDEFDSVSTLTTTGSVITTPVINFHKEVTAVDPFTDELNTNIGLPHALGIATDFTAAKQNDPLVIDGDTYLINRIIDDGIGFALIWLYTS